MEKRLVVAIALSILVLITWSALAPKSQLTENKQVTDSMPVPKSAAPKEISFTTKIDIPETPIVPVNYTNPNEELIFSEATGALVEARFPKYKNHQFLLKNGLGLIGQFRKAGSAKDSLTFVATDLRQKITKKLTFNNSNYSIELEVLIQNITNSAQKVRLPVILGTLVYNPANPDANYQDLTIASADKTQHLTPKKDLTFAELKFLGLRDRYFCIIIEPKSKGYSGYVRKLNNQEYEAGIESEEVLLAPGEQIGHLFQVYLGPQSLRLISAVKPDWTSVIHYGTFDFFAQLIWQLLEFLHTLVKSWGLAIILLSVVVYLLLFPLSLKQMRSMKEMQALQPKIEALRVQYKDNPQKMNKEVMELYREHKVNPLGGCLPLLLQMPIFFALYQVLMRSVALRGTNFLWIKDLSEPDRLFVFSKSIPILGNEINILPVIMAIGMFVQQKISTGKATGQAAEQQRMMLIIMPIMFGIIFYRMPSGLVLYWFINSALMLVFQLRINKAK
jgi:YidC/Oxa1 family membrane protein insertase